LSTVKRDELNEIGRQIDKCDNLILQSEDAATEEGHLYLYLENGVTLFVE